MTTKKNRIALSVHGMDAKVLEETELDAHVFDGTVNKKVLYQAMVGYQANRRLGLADTKTRKQVSGGGRKPWRQKGTGMSRHGSSRSPLWRHGGVVFGPHPREFRHRMPTQLRTGALRSSLNAKIKAGDLILVEKFHIMTPKTKEFVKLLLDFKTKDRVLCVIDTITENIKRSAKNIKNLWITDSHSLNALDVLNTRTVLMSRDSLIQITKRLKNV